MRTNPAGRRRPALRQRNAINRRAHHSRVAACVIFRTLPRGFVSFTRWPRQDPAVRSTPARSGLAGPQRRRILSRVSSRAASPELDKRLKAIEAQVQTSGEYCPIALLRYANRIHSRILPSDVRGFSTASQIARCRATRFRACIANRGPHRTAGCAAHSRLAGRNPVRKVKLLSGVVFVELSDNRDNPGTAN